LSFKRSIFYTFLTQAPTLLLYFVSSTLITRLLGDVGRGEYALLTNQVALLAMLVSFNVGFGITFFTSKAGGPTKSIVGTASTMLLLDIVVVPLMLLAVSGSDRLTELLMPRGRTQWLYWGYVYLSIILSLVNTAVSAFLLGMKRFKTLNWMGILNAGLSAVAFFILYFVRDGMEASAVLPTVLAVSAAAMTIQTMIWVVIYVTDVGIPPIPTWTWSILKPILAFSLVGHLTNLINLINYRFDIWVIGDKLGASELGIYTVAVGVAQLLFYIPDPFSRVVQPYLFGQLKDEMLERFKTVARLNFTAVLGLAILVAITAKWMLPLLFGEVFSASVPALYLLLPGIVLSSSSKLLAPLIVHGGLQRVNLYAISVAAVLTIVLDLIMVPIWGIEGAAVATSIVYLVIILTMLFTIRFHMGIPVYDLFLIRRSDIGRFRTILLGAPPVRLSSPVTVPRRTERVLCVVGWWPTGTDINGVFIKEHIQAIARQQRLEVLYVQVIKGRVPWPTTRIVSGMEDGLLVHRVSILTPLRRFELADRLVRRCYDRLVAEWHREDPFSLIHIHVRTEVTSHVVNVASKLSLPVVLTEHNSYYHLGILSLPPAAQEQERRSIRRWFTHPQIKLVMPVSRDLARVLQEDYGVPEEKLVVVHNVAADVFRPGPPPHVEPFRMMLAAVWRPPKDHDVFIRALALIDPEKLRSCRVDWVGYGVDYATIQERCAMELPHVDIRFPGYMNKADMARMMQQCHLFVLPTHADNLPCVVIESLCCGTPVVSMNVNGVPELVDGSNGILVPPDDPRALADALTACIEHPELFDRNLVASEAAPRFSADAISQRIVEVYASVQVPLLSTSA
jgi:glycosyltransferase involved in cell wall biosynthesis/O-antigen/teichoic acid export membrane protein